ncbi:MAG: DNA-processing protein DprA, partial [Candidatus Aenigmarchaeota archaeon]|nr:DNA-processing protein DprA [Candidatus Aenigmarchaeota archaeon]
MKLTTNQKYLIALSACLDQLGPKLFRQLTTSFSSPQQAFNSSSDQLIRIGFSSKKAKQFIQQRSKINLDKILQIIEQEDIKIVTLFDKHYPALLAEIYDPPVILFYKGKLGKNEKHPLAIVGTRKVTYYGQQAIDKIVPDLVNCGLTIISGLAFGCDSLAHQITLKNKGRTLAILGTGIDKQSIY